MRAIEHLQTRKHNDIKERQIKYYRRPCPNRNLVELGQLVTIGFYKSGNVFLKTCTYKADKSLKADSKIDFAKIVVNISSLFVDILTNYEYYKNNPKSLKVYETSNHYSQMKIKYNLTVGNALVLTETKYSLFATILINIINQNTEKLINIINEYKQTNLLELYKKFKAENPNENVSFKQFVDEYKSVIEVAETTRKNLVFLMLRIKLAIDPTIKIEQNNIITPFDIKGFMKLQPIIYKNPANNDKTNDDTSQILGEN